MSVHSIKTPKKLIEVALPLDAINVASAREKSIRHGHPSTLHLWWARRPLAAARAVIFAQMVNDPGGERGYFAGMTKAQAAAKREELFKIIEDLVLWENTNNEPVLERARAAIRESWVETCRLNKNHPQAAELFNPEKLPAFHDPFAGGGALPLEAQRLGLESWASDLNPVAVTINKAMIEIPPRFAGHAPVGPTDFLPSPRSGRGAGGEGLFEQEWPGATGLAEDVRRYGAWMRAEAEKRIGHLYPKITITPEMVTERPDLKPLLGQHLTVIAWLWARTVKSPNPAFSDVEVPLASTFVLSSKEGKQSYVQPVIENGDYRFTVRIGEPDEAAKNGTKLSRGAHFQCLMSDTPIESKHIYAEANAGRMGARLMAIVAEGVRGRIYLSPTNEHEQIASNAQPDWRPETPLPDDPRNFWTLNYGLTKFSDLFTPRQLVALTTFSDLVQEAIEKCRGDQVQKSPPPNLPPLGGGIGTEALHSLHPRAGEGGGLGGRCVGEGTEWRPTLVPPALLQAARQLRQNMTDAEQLLWQCLRGKQLDGFKFRKQHPIERFVLDFYCASQRLAIELDGGQHNSPEGRAHDAERTDILQAHGIRVIRFWNSEVLGNLEGVLTRVWEGLHAGALMEPPPQPSPAGGGSEYPAPQETPETPPPSGGRLGGGLSPVCATDDIPLDAGGHGTTAYAQAVGVYLAFVIEKLAESHSSLCTWSNSPKNELIVSTFRRQALPMTWDFGEANPFADSSGSIGKTCEAIAKVLPLSLPAKNGGSSDQADAQSQSVSTAKVISTDPPYYDNIGYADLSDFFYVWLRKSLKPIYPGLYATLAVPKAEELVATPYRHGSKEKAEKFFLDGMTQAMHNLAEKAHPAFPVTIYYAFKQSETTSETGTSSTGWETFLQAVLDAGFAITGTWPMRTERDARSIGIGTNALASSIILVCRQRAKDAATIGRRAFIRELNAALPEALLDMTRGGEPSSPALLPPGEGSKNPSPGGRGAGVREHSPIAPVDLSQAIIGPGMAIFSQYSAVLEADGSKMSVKTALQLINRFLAEDDFDHDTQFCLAWFEQQGWATGKYGEADVLARAKGTSVGGLTEAGVVESSGGALRLLRWAELSADWSPEADTRTPIWEALHQLIRALNRDGESAAGALLARMPDRAEPIRALAYRLYTLCERQGWAEDARAYNELVTAWGSVEAAAGESGIVGSQTTLDY